MTLSVDYAAHLTRAETAWSKVYPLLTEGKDAAAILAMIEQQREWLNTLEWLIRKHTKA